MGIRRRRHLVSLLYHSSVLTLGLGGLWLGIILAFQPLFDGAGILVLSHILTFRRIRVSSHLQERLIRRKWCLSCGETFDLVNQWQCSCKFTSAGRHALSPCPQCKKGFSSICCPNCGISTLI